MTRIKTMTFSQEAMKNYYDQWYLQDLGRYFCMKEIDGVPGISHHNYKFPTPVHRNEVLPAVMAYNMAQNNELPKTASLPMGTQEEVAYFVLLTRVIFENQKVLKYVFNDNVELHKFMCSLGYPIIWDALAEHNVDEFLEYENLNISFDEEDQKAYVALLNMVFPFITKKIETALREWNNHALEKTNGQCGSLADGFKHDMEEVLFQSQHTLTPKKA